MLLLLLLLCFAVAAVFVDVVVVVTIFVVGPAATVELLAVSRVQLTNHNQQGITVAVVNVCCCWLVIVSLLFLFICQLIS